MRPDPFRRPTGMDVWLVSSVPSSTGPNPSLHPYSARPPPKELSCRGCRIGSSICILSIRPSPFHPCKWDKRRACPSCSARWPTAFRRRIDVVALAAEPLVLELASPWVCGPESQIHLRPYSSLLLSCSHSPPCEMVYKSWNGPHQRTPLLRPTIRIYCSPSVIRSTCR